MVALLLATVLATSPALWVELTADQVTTGPGEVATVRWAAHGAERCTLQILADALADPPLSDDAPPTPPAEAVAVSGARAITLEHTAVATLRCEAGEQVAYADVRLHVRRPPPPLTGPRRSTTVPVGVIGVGGVGNRVGLAALAAPELAQLGPVGGVGLLVDPDLGAGKIIGPLSWTIGTPYTLQLLAAPHGAATAYAGVGARLGLRLGRLEVGTAATTGAGVGLASLPAAGGVLELVTEGRLLARWRQRRTLVVGVFVGGRVAFSGTFGLAGASGLPAMAAVAGIEVLLGIGD
jgi:hypothetical protein